MKKILLILLFLSNGFASAWCQSVVETVPSKPLYSLSLGIGLSHIGLKTEVISPLIFSGTGTSFHFTYRRESAVLKHYIQLQYQAPTLNSPFDFRMNSLDAFLTNGVLRKVKSFDKTNLFVGGEVQIMGSFRQMPQVINNDQVTLLMGLNLSSILEYSLGKHTIEVQASIAVLGYNYRAKDNFKIGAFEKSLSEFLRSESYFETLPNYLNASLRLSYIPPLNSKHFRWRIDYWGNFQRFNQRQYMGVLQNQISASLTYQF
jgi:hypothetical protein